MARKPKQARKPKKPRAPSKVPAGSFVSYSRKPPLRDYAMGYGGRDDCMTKADRVRNKMLSEAQLLEGLKDPRAGQLRELALALPIASLERLA